MSELIEQTNGREDT